MEATQKAAPLFRSEVFSMKGPSVTAAVTTPGRNFYLVQPVVNYADRLRRMEEFSGPTGLSAAEFEDRAEGLFTKLRGDILLAPTAAGVCLPVPFAARKVGDYGTDLEAVLLGTGRAYENEFPQRKFINHRKGTLASQVTVLSNTRHDRFIARLVEPVVGLYFPNLLQGFSVDAQRQQICDLPESMLLSGPIDTALAMTAYPDVLARDFNTPGLDCSAVQWRSARCSLFFWAIGGELGFDYGTDLGIANDFYSGGVLFLG